MQTPRTAIPLVALLLALTTSAAAAPQTGWPFMGGTDVAYDPTNEVYLRVGGQPQLLGEFFDEYGIRIGNPFRLSVAPDDALHPRVVYSPHLAGGAGGFMVIWTRRSPPPTYGDAGDPTYRPSTFWLRSRVVTYPDGAIGEENLIGYQGETDKLPMPNGATLAYSATSQVFYAVYERMVPMATTPPTADCCSLHGIRLDLTGAAVFYPGFAIEIEPGVERARYPAIEWNPVTNEFGIVYCRWGYLYFARVNHGGVLLERRLMQPLIDVYAWERPDIAVNTTLGRFVIAWAERFANGSRETETAELDAGGNVLRSSRVSVPINNTPRLAYNASSDRFLLVGPYAGGTHWQSQELDGHGVRIGPALETVDFGGGVPFGFPVGEGTLTVEQTRGISYANRAVWDASVRPAPGSRQWVVSYFSSDTLASQVVTLPAGELTDPSPLWTIYQQVSVNKGQYKGHPTVGFTWGGAGDGATYWLDIGFAHAGADLFSGYAPASGAMSMSVPLTGRPLYVRVWTLLAGRWRYLDYILPAPLTAAAMTFQWQPMAATSEASLHVSYLDGGGSGELHYSSEPANATSRVVASVQALTPTMLEHARIYSRLADRWVLRDFVYTALQPKTPLLFTPVPGAAVTTSNLTLSWSAPAGTQAEWLDVGTTMGGTSLFSGPHTNRTARNVTVPLNGGTIYSRLWSLNGPVWHYVDYSYPTINANGRAVLTAPAFGTLIAQPTAKFSWASVPSATQYWLDIGTSSGTANVYAASQGLNTTATVTGLPVTGRPIESDGRPLFVRLWTLVSGLWTFVDAEYQTAAPTKEATLLQPTLDVPLSGSSATFEWQKPAGTTHVWLDVGSGEGTSNVYSQGSASATSAMVSGLPTGGAPVHARLWTLIGGKWRFVDYVFPTAP